RPGAQGSLCHPAPPQRQGSGRTGRSQNRLALRESLDDLDLVVSREAKPGTDQRDYAAAVGVHEGTCWVVMDHADWNSQSTVPTPDFNPHVSALADGDAPLQSLGRDFDQDLVRLPVRLPRDSAHAAREW